jgi:hypothetical protein
MIRGKKILTFLSPAMLACGLSVQAATFDSIDVHGSISATASYSNKYGFMGDTADNLDLNLVDIILNSTHRFENGLRVGGQIYAFKLGGYKDLTLDFASATSSPTVSTMTRRISTPSGLSPPCPSPSTRAPCGRSMRRLTASRFTAPSTSAAPAALITRFSPEPRKTSRVPTLLSCGASAIP